MDFKAKTSEYCAEINHALEKATELPGVPELLCSAMRYSLEAGGKRLRPCLVLAVSDMLGGSREQALALGCGLEMVHTYSLIHDDLPCVDNDDLRRGRPSNHKVFGEGQAVFAGDALVTYAFEWTLENGLRFNSANYYKAVLELAKRAGAKGMLAGQSLDLIAEETGEMSEEALYLIHRRKTADMLIAALLMGAYTAEPTRAELEALEEYGDKIGLLFQLTDDILDAEGDEALMGKTLGKDDRNNKLTFVRLYGVDGAKRMAETIAREADGLLTANFPCGSEYLRAMIYYIKDRKN
ncbi:MAG: polyprenyl synthetase family protein [Clostridia bacterium]|nr:polyprenyl synthetase family protein [Clostridia bacterium]